MDDEPQVQLARKTDRQALSPEAPALFWVVFVVLLGLLAFSVSYFGGPVGSGDTTNDSGAIISDVAETRESKIYTVTYRGGVFSPTNLRIHAGDTVRFKNDGFFGIRIMSNPEPAANYLAGFDSISNVPPTSYFAFTFPKAGTFGYHTDGSPDEGGTIIVR